MNAGELNEKIQILTLISTENNNTTIYEWSNVKEVWAKTQRLDSHTAFSKFGKSARTARFIFRKTEIDLTNALLWQGQHCHLTDIIEIDRCFYEAAAALVEPKTCSVIRYGYTLNEHNWPILTQTSSLTFPCFLTERYFSDMGIVQHDPMVEVFTRLILVTPKAISLKSGELVQIEGNNYTVTSAHEIDENYNEFEIMKKGDA